MSQRSARSSSPPRSILPAALALMVLAGCQAETVIPVTVDVCQEVRGGLSVKIFTDIDGRGPIEHDMGIVDGDKLEVRIRVRSEMSRLKVQVLGFKGGIRIAAGTLNDAIDVSDVSLVKSLSLVACTGDVGSCPATCGGADGGTDADSGYDGGTDTGGDVGTMVDSGTDAGVDQGGNSDSAGMCSAEDGGSTVDAASIPQACVDYCSTVLGRCTDLFASADICRALCAKSGAEQFLQCRVLQSSCDGASIVSSNCDPPACLTYCTLLGAICGGDMNECVGGCGKLIAKELQCRLRELGNALSNDRACMNAVPAPTCGPCR